MVAHHTSMYEYNAIQISDTPKVATKYFFLCGSGVAWRGMVNKRWY